MNPTDCPLCGLAFMVDTVMQKEVLHIQQIEGVYASKGWTNEVLQGIHEDDNHEGANDEEIAAAELTLRAWFDSV